jgi:hypothetical protein
VPELEWEIREHGAWLIVKKYNGFPPKRGVPESSGNHQPAVSSRTQGYIKKFRIMFPLALNVRDFERGKPFIMYRY